MDNNEINVKVTADASGVDSTVKQVGSTVKQVGEEANQTSQSLGALSQAHEFMAAKAVAVGVMVAAAVQQSVAGMKDMVLHSIDAQAQMYDLSKKTGLAVEDLGAFRMVAEEGGVSMRALTIASKGFSTQLLKHSDVLKEAGISSKDFNGALIEVADKISATTDQTERQDIATKAFGKSGYALLPVLAEGGDKLQNLLELGGKYNAVTAESAAQAKEFKNKMGEINAASQKSTDQITNALLPVLIELEDAWVSLKENGIKPLLWLFGAIVIDLGVIGKAASVTAVFLTDVWTNPKKAVEEYQHSLKAVGDEGEQLRIKLAATLAGVEQIVAKIKKPVDITPDAPDPRSDAMNKVIAAQLAAEKKKYDDMNALALEAGKSQEEIIKIQVTRKLELLSDEHKKIMQIMKENDATSAERGKVEKMYQAERIDAVSTGNAKIAALHDADLLASKKQLEGFNQQAILANATARDQITWKVAFEIQKMNEEYDAKVKMHGWTEALEKSHNDNLEAIRKDGEAKIEKAESDRIKSEGNVAYMAKMIREGDYKSAAETMMNMSAGLASHSKAMFEINKAASLSNALIKGYAAIMNAYKDGTEHGGPWVGAVEAAIAAAFVATQVTTIASAQYGGGGSVSTPSSSGGASGGVASMPTQANQTVNSVPVAPPSAGAISSAPNVVNIQMQGGANLYSADSIRNLLIPALNQAVGDGVIINVTG